MEGRSILHIQTILRTSSSLQLVNFLKMLEQKVRVQATANLEFEVDRRAVKKTKDVSFDPLPGTSSFEVKTDQPPLN
jgi:hypothetical protein